MGLIPFKRSAKSAGYAAASSPRSKGRMPDRHSSGTASNTTEGDTRTTTPAPPVDGGLRGHDTNYPRKGALKD